MRLVETSAVPDVAQESFLHSLPESLFYHSPNFQRLLTTLLGCRQRSMAVLDGENVKGMMFLMEADGPQGRILNSLPFYGSHGGLLVQNETARQILVDWYGSIASGEEIAACTIIENPLAPVRSFKGFKGDFVDERIGQFTPLSSTKTSPDGLMASLHSKTRNSIRKARSYPFVVESNPAHLRTLVRIHGENFRSKATNPKPDRFFELVPQIFREGDDWQCWICRKDDEVVAALLVFHFNGVTEYYTPAVREEYRSSQALSLVIFEAMLDSARRGMRYWNWGGTWPSQKSIYQFKSRWGTLDMPYRYRSVVSNPDLFAVAPNELLAHYPHFYVRPFIEMNGR